MELPSLEVVSGGKPESGKDNTLSHLLLAPEGSSSADYFLCYTRLILVMEWMEHWDTVPWINCISVVVRGSQIELVKLPQCSNFIEKMFQLMALWAQMKLSISHCIFTYLFLAVWVVMKWCCKWNVIKRDLGEKCSWDSHIDWNLWQPISYLPIFKVLSGLQKCSSVHKYLWNSCMKAFEGISKSAF